MTLNKRILRSFKTNFSFFLFSIILTIITVAFIISAISTGQVLKDVMAEFMTSYNTENAEFTVYNDITEDEIKSLEKEFDIALEKNRYKDISYENTTIRVFSQTKKVNQYQVHTGNDLSRNGDLLITERYASLHNISIGDIIEISGKEFNVCGYAVKSDYIYMLQSLSDSYRNNNNFALAIVNDEDFDTIGKNEINFYGVIYKSDNSLAVRQTLNERYIIRSYINDQSNTRISLPANEGDGVKGMAMVFGPVLFLIVIILIALLLSRMINSEQKLIGTFIALGYKKSEIIRHYAFYGLIPGLAGSAFGLILSIFFTKALSKFYIENDYEKINYTMHFSVPAVVAGIILPVLLYTLTTVFVTRSMLRKKVVLLLNHMDEKKKTVNVLTKSNLRTRTKLKFRSILGHIPRSVITVTGVMTASIAVLMGLMMYSSMKNVINNGVADSTNYKYQYVLNYIGEDKPQNGEKMLSMTFEVPDSTVQLSLNGIAEGSDYFVQKMDLSGYTITSAAAQVYGLHTGSVFSFRNPISLKEHTITVGNIIEDNMHCSIYTGLDNAAEIMGVESGCYNNIISNEELPIDDNEVAAIISTRSTQESLKELMSPIMIIVYIIVIVGMMLCAFIMYLVMNIVINENKPNISLMKILGFKKTEISSTLLSINHILLVIGYIIAIPVAYIVCSTAMRNSMDEYGICMKVTLNLFVILAGFLAVSAGYMFSFILQKRKAYMVDMALILREARKD